ncbi:MAG: alpha/beta hydrolase [Elusimicrobia bacterium]|nr:alpha/beta hydrolase [Elusimicrobiota bacterium]
MAAWPCLACKKETIQTAAGPIETAVSRPKGKGPFPLLVIAPAKQYTMEGKIFEELAHGAAGLGYYVVRFNWGYIPKKSEPSADLSAEAKELDAVIEHFRKESKVDAGRVVLAAKSFGTKVAMLGPEQKARALLLLTPNCDAERTFRKTYQPVFASTKKAHVVISVNDPYCDINQIHEALKDLGSRVTVHTLFGDHNFVLKSAASDINEKAAIQSSLNWLRQVQDN